MNTEIPTNITADSQSIGLEGINNARELGGYPTEDGRRVKRGVLLRTAKLSSGTAADFERLRDVYHLAKIIDLRSDEEIYGSELTAAFTGTMDADPDPVIENAEYINIPILDMKKQKAYMDRVLGDRALPDPKDTVGSLALFIELGIISDELYYWFVDEDMGKEGFRRLFRELLTLKNGRALLFHCSQGKDRTGTAAMLILSLLGVSEKIIIKDYLLTNIFNSERIEYEKKMLEASGKVPPEKLDTFLMAMDKVNVSSMTKVIAHIKEKYGSVGNYIINELGITDDEAEMLRNKFLEEKNAS